MSIASKGYDGTLDEADFARLMALAGRPPIVGGATDLLVEPVAGARAVTLRPGTAYATGVEVIVAADAADGVPRLSLPTPTNGQFFLVTLRRDWAANNSDPEAGEIIDGSSFQVLSSDTSANVRPATPPTVMPALAADPGVAADQPVAWVWATSASTEVAVWDLRTWEADWERVPSDVARDAIPAERLWVGKRVHVTGTGITYRRAATTWNREGVTPVTSDKRPSEPYLNQLIFETDTKQFAYWDGGAWVSPSRDASSIGSGTVPLERLPDSVQQAAKDAGAFEARLGRTAQNWTQQSMNDAVDSGFYRGNAMANAPTGDWLYFIVIKHDDGYVKQLAFHFFGTGMWIRKKDGGNWSGWEQVPNLSDLRDGGLLDSRYYREDEINSFFSDRDGRITDARSVAGDAWAKANDAQLNRSTPQDVENRINGRGLSQVVAGGLFVDATSGGSGIYTGTVTVSLPGRIGTPGAVLCTVASNATQNSQATVASVSNGSFVLKCTRGNPVNTYCHWLAINTYF